MQATQREFDPATLDLATPEHYERHGYPHAEWTWLRRHDPVFWYERSNVDPFWAITKHADIIELGKQPDVFLNAPRLAVFTNDLPPPPEGAARHLLNMDPPEHARYRRVTSAWFTPRAIRGMDDKVGRVTREVLDDAAQKTSGDFVRDISARITIAVIAEMLGVPRRDWELLFRWTNEIIGKEDPEYRRPGETPGQTIKRARGELHAYFEHLIEERRRRPRDDLISQLIAARIHGTPLNPEQLISYCELLVEAGNETTRNAISGGLLAFAERSDEWKKLRTNPGLLPDAVEEILRWVSPISHFTRVATEEVEVGGATIQSGDQVALYFASANRDEDVFGDPFVFRIDRRPNPHLAFGFGEHFCMGAHLARVELETMFRHLLARLESFEVCGPVERMSSIINGSIKRLPIRCRLT